MEQVKITWLIDKAKEQLVSYGYSESSIKVHLSTWRRLQSFAILNEVKYYTEELMLAFMEEECRVLSEQQRKKWQADKMCILNKLDEYCKYQMISSKRYSARKEYVFKGEIGCSVKDYIKFRKTNVSESRLQSIQLYLERFCEYTDTMSVASVRCLNAKTIQCFIESCSIYTKSTVAGTACCLRGYLEFIYTRNLSELNLSAFVP